jgi:hypothetical protein
LKTRLASLALALGFSAHVAAAAPPVKLVTEAFVYADNTEFFNPYRTGETIFGLWAREYFSARLGENVEVRAGVFVNERFGDERSFELVRPVISLRIGTERSRFVLGTLETVRRADGIGPDVTTLHGLLPPIQVETLAFTRPYENGVQWILDTERLKNDVFLSWQKLNTPEHREVLDAGLAGRAHVIGPLWAGAQFHVVHHGGQLYDVGPVTDSFAYGPGVMAAGPLAFLDRASAEAYFLFSSDKRDREDPNRTTTGHGAFLRLAGEKNGWRGHLIVWRAADFVKEEGDPNYLSRSEDGATFRSSRTYGELGLTKVFRPVSGVELEPSFRLHRVDTSVEYSYRLIARVTFDLPVIR